MESIDLSSLSKKKQALAIDKVQPAPFNPPIRTANKTGDIDKLAQAIAVEGQLEPVHVVSFPDGKYYAADGNRRRKAMVSIGAKNIDAIVYQPGDNDPTDVLHALFVSLNDKKRRLANRDMVEVGLADGPIFNDGVKSTVDQLHTLFPTGIPSIVKDNAGTHVLSIAKRTVKYCWSSLSKDSPTFRRHVAVTLLWLVRNKQQQKVVAYMRLKFSPEALKRAIEQNKLTPRVNA